MSKKMPHFCKSYENNQLCCVSSHTEKDPADVRESTLRQLKRKSEPKKEGWPSSFMNIVLQFGETQLKQPQKKHSPILTIMSAFVGRYKNF